MSNWSKFLGHCESRPWLRDAIARAQQVDDHRSLRVRCEKSISHISFRPFSEASPAWAAQSSWQALHNRDFHPKTGVFNQSHPILVSRFDKQPEQFRWVIHRLSPSLGENNCTVAAVMRDELRDAQENPNRAVTWVALVKPQLIFVPLHQMTSESYEVYQFPKGFSSEDFALWVKDAPDWVPAHK